MSDMQFEGFGEDQPFEGFGDDESFEGFEGRATLNNEGNNLEDEKGIVNSSDILSYQGNDSKAVASLVPKATSSDKVSAKKKTKGDDHLQKTENVYQSQDNIVDTPSFKEETLNKTSSDRTDEKVTQKQSKSSSSRQTSENGSSGSRSATKKKGTRLDPIETFPTYQEGLFAPPSEPRRKGSNMKFLLALQKPGHSKRSHKDLSEDKRSFSMKVSKEPEKSKRSHTSSAHTNLAKLKTPNRDEKDRLLKKRKRLLSKSASESDNAEEEKVEKSSKRCKIENICETKKKSKTCDKAKTDKSGSSKELDSVSEAMNLLDSNNELESSLRTAESYPQSNDRSSFRNDGSESNKDKTVVPTAVPAGTSRLNEYSHGNPDPSMENNTSEEQSIKTEPVDSQTPVPDVDFTTRKSPIGTPNRRGTHAVQMNDPVLLAPFEHGFRRELVYRASGDSADVYYFSPVGKKLRSMRDVEIYLKLNNCPLATPNFTFFKSLISSNSKFDVARTAGAPGCRPDSRSSNASSMASSSLLEENGAVTHSRRPRTKSKVRVYGSRKKKRQAASAKKLFPLKISLKKPLVSSLDISKEQEPLTPSPVSQEVEEEKKGHQEKRIPTLTIRKPVGETSWHRSENIETMKDYSLAEDTEVKSEIIDDSVQDQQTDVAEEISNYDRIVSSDLGVNKSLANNRDKSLTVDEQLTDTAVVPPSDGNQSVSISVRKSSDLFPSSPKERRKVKLPSRFLDSSPEPSSPSKVTDKQPVVQQTRKLVSPVVPCTVLCQKARGEYPQLPCSVCLCFYHKQCLGYSSNSVIDPFTLVCPSCQNLSSFQTRSINSRKSLSGKISSSRKASYNSGGNRIEIEMKSQKEQKRDIVNETINMVVKYPDESHASKPQASSYAQGVIAAIQKSGAEVPQSQLVPVSQNLKEVKDACVQTEEEQTLPAAVHPPPPALPIAPPVVGSQTIEHIRDKQNRLRRFVVISNTPVSLERPCPFTPHPEPFELVPESARIPTVTDQHLDSIAQIEESVEDVIPPKKLETPACRTDLMNSLSYTYKSLLYVFSFLTVAERGQAALVCKLWHKGANDPALCRYIDTRKLKIRSLHNFFTRVRKLEIESLDLRGIERKQRDSLYKYLNVPDAKKIVMCPCGGEIIEMLLRTCHNLVEFDASDVLSTSMNLSEIKNQHRLEKLVLHFSTDTEVSELSGFKKLHKMKCLSLLGVVNIVDISFLEFMPRLETLSLGNLTSLIKESFHESLLRNVKHLKYLKLVEGPDWDINLSILRSFGSLEQLTVLEVLRFKIEQSIKDLFHSMPNLEKFLLMPVLSFDSMDAVLGDFLDHLSSLLNLKQFCLVLPDECILFDGSVVVRRETIERLDALRARISVSSDVESREVLFSKYEKSGMTEGSFHRPNTIIKADVNMVDPDVTSNENSDAMLYSDNTPLHGSKLKQSEEITSALSEEPVLSGSLPDQNHTEEHGCRRVLDSVASASILDVPQCKERELDKEVEDSVFISEMAKVEGALATEDHNDVDVQFESFVPEKTHSEPTKIEGELVTEGKGSVELTNESVAKTLQGSDQVVASGSVLPFHLNPTTDLAQASKSDLEKKDHNLDELENLPKNLEAERVGNVGNFVSVGQAVGFESGSNNQEIHNLKFETESVVETHQEPESTLASELNIPTGTLQTVENDVIKGESVNPSVLDAAENVESFSSSDSQDDLKTKKDDGTNHDSIEDTPAEERKKLLITSQNEIEGSYNDNSQDVVVNEKDQSSKEFTKKSLFDIDDMDWAPSTSLNSTEKELELEKSGFKNNVEMDLQLSDEEGHSENELVEKVKFKIGSSESSSSVPYDASQSVSARESENYFASMFNPQSVDDSLAQESNSAVESQPILSSFHEPQDENAHLGPPTPLETHNENTMSSTQEQKSEYSLEPSTEVSTSTSKDGAIEKKSSTKTADTLCTVTPEDLLDYFKLALPNVQICVVKVNDEALRTFRLDNIDWKDSSFISLC
ncbi:uncharacterized protein LOC136028741 isoform X2 [Artemia franciscana]